MKIVQMSGVRPFSAQMTVEGAESGIKGLYLDSSEKTRYLILLFRVLPF